MSRPGTLRVLDIVAGTSVDGPGLRTSVYLAGCGHACPGCHNPQSWAFDGGEERTLDSLMAVLAEEDFDVTLTGGDPLYQLEGVVELARRIRHELHKTVWLYTGFTIEQIRESPTLRRILEVVDVIVDGPFVEAERDLNLRFRGSRNQRIIELQAHTEAEKRVVK